MRDANALEGKYAAGQDWEEAWEGAGVDNAKT